MAAISSYRLNVVRSPNTLAKLSLLFTVFQNPPWQIIAFNETGHASLNESKGVVLDILKSIALRLNFTYSLHISTSVISTVSMSNSSLDDTHNTTVRFFNHFCTWVAYRIFDFQTQDIHLLTSNIPSDVFQMLHENRIILAAVAATVNTKYEKFVSTETCTLYIALYIRHLGARAAIFWLSHFRGILDLVDLL